VRVNTGATIGSPLSALWQGAIAALLQFFATVTSLYRARSSFLCGVEATHGVPTWRGVSSSVVNGYTNVLGASAGVIIDRL
jgi:hypothetical protein